MLKALVLLLVIAPAAIAELSMMSASLEISARPSQVDFDHYCSHDPTSSSVRLQVVADDDVLKSKVVQWKLDGLSDDYLYAWQESPDMCNVKPGLYRASFKAISDDVTIAVPHHEIHVDVGRTTVLYLRMQTKLSDEQRRLRRYVEDGQQQAPSTIVTNDTKEPVKTYSDALMVEDLEAKCESGNAGCHPQATCSVTAARKVKCECNEGFAGNGKRCVEALTCDQIDLKCTNNSRCVMISPTKGSCFCKKGYAGMENTTQAVCYEINACLTVYRGHCHKHAFCEKSGPGTARCTCNSGYSGNGIKCLDVRPPSNGTKHRVMLIDV